MWCGQATQQNNHQQMALTGKVPAHVQYGNTGNEILYYGQKVVAVISGCTLVHAPSALHRSPVTARNILHHLPPLRVLLEETTPAYSTD